MLLKESPSLKGQLRIVCYDLEENPVFKKSVKNLITNYGRRYIAEYLIGKRKDHTGLYIAVGTGETVPVRNDTELINQVSEIKISEENFELSCEDDEVNATVKVTFPPMDEGKEQLLREAGILIKQPDGSSVLYNRTVFPLLTWTDKLKMTLCWDLKF